MASPSARAQRRTAALLLAPFSVLFAAVTLAPLGYAGWMSLFTTRTSGLGFGGTRQVFTGLANYANALSDPAFRDGFVTIAVYAAVYVPVMIGGALALALLLDSALVKARSFFQLALFLPHAVPGLIAALIWVYLYTPGLSPVVDLLNSLDLHVSFLSADNAVFSAANIALWEWMGYNMVIFYAALQAVPGETLDAARIDGAGGLRTALSIKLPMIRPAVALAVLFTVIGSVQLFTEPKVIYSASSAIGSSWTPNLYVQTAAFTRNDFGLAAAASLLIALFAAVLSFLVTRISRSRSQS
ncbi:carbohydrate ABC transporter permease [Kitasatospora viridis]|uniref:Carbohydrate ABC transporter membrane protein 1 (CUT1 family) n=1 Tax=Kitasatospora viridis TaxID=281105 RepID=A0A561T673_9ACTN|nr:sugar ABC transporter permease [Kitasatospora viridis]TWF82610.1 carbohydrate ABC transporter membrane protein 1 (CUT1 family) [Kitasatospora viridis]